MHCQTCGVCDRCHKECNGWIKGFEEQHGEKWCVDCCLEAGLQIPYAVPSHRDMKSNAVR